MKGYRSFAAAMIALVSLSGSAVEQSSRMIVLGVDGMDPILLQEYMQRGLLPNLSRLAQLGGVKPLGTSIPPQSPVAWSNFITGMDPGGHGVFDFIALDREKLTPYLSTARVEKSEWGPLRIGPMQIPLAAERTVQLRDGVAFWELLEAQGIPTTMFRIPANYPPIETGGQAVSGMGTPDLQGTSGTFTYYTDDPSVQTKTVSGGVIRHVENEQGRISTVLQGPPNPFFSDGRSSEVELTVYVDRENPVALIRLGDTKTLLGVGEWSDWIPLQFELLPGLASVPGMVRFLLKHTEPTFALYASPVNIDPRNPAQTISTPAEYAFELAESVGPFYTQEMPEDTKALSAHVLDPREFLSQSELVLNERRRLLKHELEVFRTQDTGLLFFYLSSVDQRHHMMARYIDTDHPFHDPDTPTDLAESMQTTYQEIDELVGWVLGEINDDTTVIVMSDHGFAPFRRQVNLNTWLEQQGYLTLKDPSKRDSYEWLDGIDWSDTRAFSIGLNSLYLNVRGRERHGIVRPSERVALAKEIAGKLHAWRDSETGENVVTHAALREDVYHGPHVEAAPDILVGYARGYRASWATTTGEIPETLIIDNDHEWSGDHCMDARAVPGVLLSNRSLKVGETDLQDLTISILASFGLKSPAHMSGTSVF